MFCCLYLVFTFPLLRNETDQKVKVKLKIKIKIIGKEQTKGYKGVGRGGRRGSSGRKHPVMDAIQKTIVHKVHRHPKHGHKQTCIDTHINRHTTHGGMAPAGLIEDAALNQAPGAALPPFAFSSCPVPRAQPSAESPP